MNDFLLFFQPYSEFLQNVVFPWLSANLTFMHTSAWTAVYGFIVILNPIAMAPQLVNSIRCKPEELRGVSVSMFFIFFAIQTAVALGSVLNNDASLFTSMAISAIETATIIAVTLIRRE